MNNNQQLNPANPFNQLNEINDLILLNIAETQTQKIIKKILFIVISIIFPISEIALLLYQNLSVLNVKYEEDQNFPNELNNAMLGFFSFSSLLCT